MDLYLSVKPADYIAKNIKWILAIIKHRALAAFADLHICEKPPNFITMKLKWTNRIILIIVCMQMTSAANEDDGNEHRNCSLGFTSHQIVTLFTTKTICAKIHQEKDTWFHARDRCSLEFSYLTHRFYVNSTLYSELLDAGIEVLWVGIHRRANFFVTENPSKVFREVTKTAPELWGYQWSTNEPALVDCVALNVATGYLYTRDCKSRLPFICDDDGKGVSRSLISALSCPERWVTSISLSTSNRTCISPTFNKTSFHGAVRTCSEYKSRLATSEEYDILTGSESSYSLKKWRYWIKTDDLAIKNACPVKYLKPDTNVITELHNCSLKTSFICVKSFEFPNIQVQISPSIIEPQPSYSPNATDLLLCNAKREEGASKIEGAMSYQWYKDEIPISFRSYVLRISFADDALNRDILKWNNATRMGYYHCEVRYEGSTKLYSSPKVKFSYSDIAAYVIDIGGIKAESTMDYSKGQFFNTYIKDFDGSTMSSVMESLESNYPEAEWDFKNMSIRGEDLSVKIVVYIYRTGVDAFDDRLTCEEVQEALENHLAVPVEMDISQNIVFRTNCEDFPATFAYRLTKSLNAAILKIHELEETQMEIVEMLKTLHDTVNGGTLPTAYGISGCIQKEESFDPNLLFILRAVNEKKLRHIQDETTSEQEFDTRERNEFEGVPWIGKPLYLGSKTKNTFGCVGSKGQIHRSRGVTAVNRKKLYNVPAENTEGRSISTTISSEKPLSGRVHLVGTKSSRIFPLNSLPERIHPENTLSEGIHLENNSPSGVIDPENFLAENI